MAFEGSILQSALVCVVCLSQAFGIYGKRGGSKETLELKGVKLMAKLITKSVWVVRSRRGPCSRSCDARHTVHQETEIQQVRWGLSLADTQTGRYAALYSRRLLGATLLKSLPSSPLDPYKPLIGSVRVASVQDKYVNPSSFQTNCPEEQVVP